MKKLFCLLTVCLMMFSMVACDDAAPETTEATEATAPDGVIADIIDPALITWLITH